MADHDEVRWGLAQRFEFIEWRVYWTGRVNRGDLVERFGVSTPQASVDLRAYQETAPNNIHYDSTEKAYVALPSFRALYLDVSADRYLLHSPRRNIDERYLVRESAACGSDADGGAER
jgi:hypothetical protein